MGFPLKSNATGLSGECNGEAGGGESMNAVKGTNRLILDDMRLYLVIFTSIALGLTAVYVAIGFLFDVRYSSQLFGPMYGGSVRLPLQV